MAAEPVKDVPGDKYEYMSDYRTDLDMHDKYIVDFDAYEAMLISKTYDSVSRETKSGITDSDAATMIIERSARVVGQLPDGEVEAAGKKDAGKALFMDILRQKWIYPNANAQRPFLDKIRLWDMYSSIYGLMPMFIDWDVAPNGYIGPNCWLWNPRNFIPQAGRDSIGDMDYVHAIAWMSEADVEDLIDNWTKDSGWNLENLRTALESVKGAAKDMDTSRTSFVERERNTQAIKGRLKVVTRFERGEDGRWITFSPDVGALELRNTPNPHKNNKIPFVIKPSIPLLDSFYNLSDMARAMPIQFAKDGLTNFYFQGIKQNIYPATVVNAQGILKHTISNEPGAIWEEIIPNSARRLETSTAGLATYQAAMGQMSGALQNVFGTTTTQLTQDQSAGAPQFGKTPQAIKFQTQRESARDNQNRSYLQVAIEEMLNIMFELIANMGTEAIPINLFAKDIQEIQTAGYTDVMELILPNESRQAGRLILDPKSLKGVTYRFQMKPDSTMKLDKEARMEGLANLMNVLSQHQNELYYIQKTTGQMINWPVLINSYAELVGLPGITDVFMKTEIPPDLTQNPAMRMMDRMNIAFEKLPQDAQVQFLKMWGVTSQGTSVPQQQVEVNAAKVASDHVKNMSGVLADHAPEAPQAPQAPEAPEIPQAVSGALFHDKTVAQMAKHLHGQRPKPIINKPATV